MEEMQEVSYKANTVQNSYFDSSFVIYAFSIFINFVFDEIGDDENVVVELQGNLWLITKLSMYCSS